MIANSVFRRIEVRVRGATSPWRIVPNAPWMSPACALSRTALETLVSLLIKGSKHTDAPNGGAARIRQGVRAGGARHSADVLAGEAPPKAPARQRPATECYGNASKWP